MRYNKYDAMGLMFVCVNSLVVVLFFPMACDYLFTQAPDWMLVTVTPTYKVFSPGTTITLFLLWLLNLVIFLYAARIIAKAIKRILSEDF